MRSIGYARVSTEKQADRGVSLEAQAAKIRAMAVVQGADLLDLIVDGGESAKDLRRPGMVRLLELVDARAIDQVIVAKLDRLTRSVCDLGTLLEQFQKRNVSLVSVSESLDTGTAAGRLVLNVMASVSQWEREAIGERTRDALQHKRSQGFCIGNVPFGFCLDADGRTLIPEAREQQVLTMIREYRDARYPLRKIADELNRQGISTRSGSPWRHGYIVKMLARTQQPATVAA